MIDEESQGTEVIEQVANEEQSSARDFDAEARLQGWVPQDDFKGQADKWVDAESFVKRGEEIIPFLKKNNENLKVEIDKLKKSIKRLSKAEQSAYDNALSDLKSQMREAVASGDTEEFDKVEAKVEKLKKEAADDVGQTHAEDPVEAFDTFREENTWFDRAALPNATEVEIEARLYADRIAQKWEREGLPKTMGPSEFFAKVAAETERRFPALKMKKAVTKPASAVAGVTNGAVAKGAKTGANLPPEAKRQAERFFNQGVIKAKDLSEALNKYASTYDWS